MDDLRDYRFYEENMTHPNKLAVDYIWDKLVQTLLSAKSREALPPIRRLRQAMAHRPSFAQSTAYQNFLKKEKKFLQNIKKDYPDIDWSEEDDFFGRILLT